MPLSARRIESPILIFDAMEILYAMEIQGITGEVQENTEKCRKTEGKCRKSERSALFGTFFAQYIRRV
ncbi:MAG TPA: hypothetical protein DEB39_06180 [Planctomycetaceae bacterium]|nr:hypothetical protein [Planctomycetaceae bacterium]